MSGLHKQYKTNAELENKGVDIRFEEAKNDDDSVPVFKISRMGKSNKGYAKALEAATRPYRRQIELSTLKNEVAEKMMLEVFVGNVLVGWENVQDEKGEALQFNKENAIRILTELPDVYERLQEEAKIASNFRDFQLDGEAKN